MTTSINLMLQEPPPKAKRGLGGTGKRFGGCCRFGLLDYARVMVRHRRLVELFRTTWQLLIHADVGHPLEARKRGYTRQSARHISPPTSVTGTRKCSLLSLMPDITPKIKATRHLSLPLIKDICWRGA